MYTEPAVTEQGGIADEDNEMVSICIYVLTGA